MRPGVRLAVDVGDVRIGVARSDREGLIATPVETVPGGPDAIDRILEVAAAEDAVEILVGLPLSLSGAEGRAAASARAFAARLAVKADPMAVRLVDERLTTVSAARDLRAAGVSSRAGRAVVDQAAAVIMLQAALDAERASGRPPGEVIARFGSPQSAVDEQGVG